MASRPLTEPPVREEFERGTLDASQVGEIRRDLSTWERITNITAVRRAFVLVMLAVIWEIYGRVLDNSLIIPPFSDTMMALWGGIAEGELLTKAWVSVSILLKGYFVGIALAAILTSLAIATRMGFDVLTTLTAMFNPLPAIALLPLAMLWFGLGEGSLIFVLIHAVLWAVSLNTLSGFQSVSTTLRMAGRNYGLTGLRYVTRLLIPAAFPTILTGMKIGWAFAWRTQIAAELVFGVASGSGGLGWFIFLSRNELQIDSVFAGLIVITLIGLFVEMVIFRTIENRTVRKWGMQQ